MRRGLAGIALIALVAAAAPAAADPDPAPGSPGWYARDAGNQLDATGRLQDAYTNPALGTFFWVETAGGYPANASDQAHNPTRPILTLAQWIPGGTTADPYRRHWEGERGIRSRIEYRNRYGARITGNVWAPGLPYTDPLTGTSSSGPFPGVVVTTGSIQGYEELYWWAAQGLAEAGYVVMTYDVQGQGQSETFAHHPDGSLWCASGECPGVPFQQNANFFEGTADALDWFLSTANPLRGLVDASRIGLAGHSLGATAVTQVGNAELRVDAVVAWDNASIGSVVPRVPTMGQNADYFFNPQPAASPPPPDSKRGTFLAFRGRGVPAMQVALRSSTHLEWTWVPYILPASREGERVGMHYTLAWFDRWLKGATSAAHAADARARLLATTFDGSADTSAIGAGAYDPATNANVPHTIAGDAVADHLSFYYRSSYAFDGYDCGDMRLGC